MTPTKEAVEKAREIVTQYPPVGQHEFVREGCYVRVTQEGITKAVALALTESHEAGRRDEQEKWQYTLAYLTDEDMATPEGWM